MFLEGGVADKPHPTYSTLELNSLINFSYSCQVEPINNKDKYFMIKIIEILGYYGGRIYVI
jgi:hypothetical protein